MAEWSKAAVSKTAKMVTSSRVRILPGLLKELDYCVMVSTSDFGSDSLGSNPGSPAKSNVGVAEWSGDGLQNRYKGNSLRRFESCSRL